MINNNNLWVYWQKPEVFPASEAIVLSFLNPGDEEELKNKFKGKVISARQVAPKIKDQARKIYIDLVANIGIFKNKKGKTFRQELKLKDGPSLWWFHKVSAKDCETDPTFKFITEILIIDLVAREENKQTINLVGGYKEIVAVLQSNYKTRGISCRLRYGLTIILIKSFLSRVKYFFSFSRQWLAVRKLQLNESKFDVVFLGFWDWSLGYNRKSGQLEDHYFKALPKLLEKEGLKVGWFLWFSPYLKKRAQKVNFKKILEPLAKHGNLIIIQSLLKIGDLVKALFNLKPIIIYLQVGNKKKFKRIFNKEGLNFFPLFKYPLLHGFLNSNIPNFELVYLANKRAFKRHATRVSVSFLEFFLQARTFYAASKAAEQNIINYTIQHASYSREKTFGQLDSQVEFKGQPDNCPVPQSDYFMAMGELGGQIFAESGFVDNRLVVSGSSRYRDVSAEKIEIDLKANTYKNVLLVTSLDVDLEMAMVEAACLACQGIPQIKLFLRGHPFARIEKHPAFLKYQDRVNITKNTLEEDLQNTDLIIFTYSTVAEEAFIRGVPVWQWLPVSYNASIFRDIPIIPQFFSISDLKISLKKFIVNPSLFVPQEEKRQYILRQCFYSADGKNNQKIAKHIKKHL